MCRSEAVLSWKGCLGALEMGEGEDEGEDEEALEAEVERSDGEARRCSVSARKYCLMEGGA